MTAMNRVQTVTAVFQIDLTELAALVQSTPERLGAGNHGRHPAVWRRVKVASQIARLAIDHIETTEIPRWARLPLPAVDGLTALEAIQQDRGDELYAGMRNALSW